MNTIQFSKKITVQLLLSLIILSLFCFRASGAEASEKETPAALIAAIQQRNTEMDAREQKIIEREARLSLLEEEVKKMLDHYIRLKAEIDQQNSQAALAAKKAEEERIKRLAKIYQSMEAKDAASRIKNMKKETALGLLRKIKEKQAAKILSNMSPQKATQFSEAFIKPDK
ncbi:MAG: MotE family protein [Nitrospiria bacterium]